MDKISGSRLLTLLLLNFAFFGVGVITASSQNSLEQLDARLKSQYAAIEKEIGAPPAYVDFPEAYRVVLRAWQDRLANRFSEAATTVEEIIKLNPANSDFWLERLETLRLYS